MSDFNTIFESLKGSAEDYIESNLKEHAADVRKDARDFLDDSKADLEKYTMQLEQGIITKEQFESLMLDLKDNLVLEGALQAGLSQIRADQIRSGIITILTQAVFRILL
jgi:hypothetical protein